MGFLLSSDLVVDSILEAVLDARSSIEASCARGQQQRLVTEVIHRAAAWSRDHPCARRYDATDNSTMPFS